MCPLIYNTFITLCTHIKKKEKKCKTNAKTKKKYIYISCNTFNTTCIKTLMKATENERRSRPIGSSNDARRLRATAAETKSRVEVSKIGWLERPIISARVGAYSLWRPEIQYTRTTFRLRIMSGAGQAPLHQRDSRNTCRLPRHPKDKIIQSGDRANTIRPCRAL